MKKKTYYNPSYYQKNKERFRKRHREWCRKNREKRNAYMREYKRKRRREHPKIREKERLENKKYRKRNRAKNTLYYKKHYNGIKMLARRAVFIALDGGKLIKPKTCEVCAKRCKPQGHHPDYRKPLSVIWVCSLCHAQIHWKH